MPQAPPQYPECVPLWDAYMECKDKNGWARLAGACSEFHVAWEKCRKNQLEINRRINNAKAREKREKKRQAAAAAAADED
mmetsp:Transcript_12518/g.29290  ORF Transcript_12518/g.29290 Transcript_12518/m.29290 type:complete len:80 (+) Transcript_12518:3-242(+)